MRRAATLLVWVLLAACTAADSGQAGSGSTGSTSTKVPDTVAGLAAPARYQPLPGEPAPEAKQIAADTVQALTTFEAGPDPAAAAGAGLAALGVPAGLVDQARPLLVAGAAAAGDIVYPQLGGLTADAASVMVVVRQRLLTAGVGRTVVRTVDVRLARRGPAWAVTAIASAGGTPPDPAPPPSASAAPILADPNVGLADSARWDILAGGVDDRLLAVMARLAKDHRIDVTVLATGHPHEVFGSSHVSNHTEGRAVDIWAVDGRPVLEQRDPAGPLASLSRSLLADGVTELGGPWDLDGPGGASFTNTLHQDHLHVGFDR